MAMGTSTAIALGVTAASAAAAAKAAADQRKEAARRERVNNQLSALDTSYGTLVGSKAGGKLAEMDAGPGLLGGALTGGLSGYKTGSEIGNSLDSAKIDNAYADTLKQGGNAPNLGIPSLTEEYAAQMPKQAIDPNNLWKGIQAPQAQGQFSLFNKRS